MCESGGGGGEGSTCLRYVSARAEAHEGVGPRARKATDQSQVYLDYVDNETKIVWR